MKDKSKDFEVHQAVGANSDGDETYMPVNRDDVAVKTKMTAMATDVANEIIGCTVFFKGTVKA